MAFTNFPVPFGNMSSTASSNFTSSLSGSGNSSSNDEDLLVSSQKPTYLQALLGDNPPIPGNFEHASLAAFSSSQSQQTNEVLSGLVSSSDTTDCLVDALQMCSMTPLSYSSNQRRNRSLSMSAIGTSLPINLSSPLRSREHTSEAGSPTLEQVLLMSKTKSRAQSIDYGYGSMMQDFSGSGDGLYTSFLPSSYKETQTVDQDPYTQQTGQTMRPSFREIEAVDIAVAEAVHNLQTLKQKQVALYSEFKTPVSTVTPSQSSFSTDSVFNNLFTPLSNSITTSSGKSLLNNLVKERDSTGFHQGSEPQDLERAARLYRSAASHCEASCTWSGQLPPRTPTAAPNSSYSTKIFLGGVPWDISEQSLVQAFSEFGDVRVEWPGRDYTSPPKGYLYLVFEEEGDVKDLLAKCNQDFTTRDSYYYKISSRRMRAKDKEVQIIPWVLSDSNYARCQSQRLDPQKTVFVGALHGMMTAEALAVVFNDLFSGVIYAGLDTDKHKYPIGSGRVTFNNKISYMKAVGAAFIEIKTPRFSKKVQVDPYLEDTLCSMCTMKQGPYFCREKSCFNYFCHSCWEMTHASIRPQHKPLMRNIRGITRARASQSGYHHHGYHHHHDFNNNGGKYHHRQGHGPSNDPNKSLSDYFTQAFGS